MPPKGISVAEAMEKMVDLKSIARPPTCNGSEKEWASWKFRFGHVMGLLGLSEGMRAAEVQAEAYEQSALADDDKAKSMMLYTILVQTCSGKAMSIIQLVPNSNGSRRDSITKRQYFWCFITATKIQENLK